MVPESGTKSITVCSVKRLNLKIARHLERKHGMECDVAYAFSFPVGSKQRKTLIEGLRNKGDWQHNHMVFKEGNGEIVVWKRPSVKADVESYLPCQHCYAMFKRAELWRHEKSCRERKEERQKGTKIFLTSTSTQIGPRSTKDHPIYATRSCNLPHQK